MGCGASTIVKYITLKEIRFPDYFNGDRADNATRLLHRVAWNLHPNGCEEERMDANLWIELMRGALMKLFEFRHVLNDTNVYPTPDRDTGRNMMWTMRGGEGSLYYSTQKTTYDTYFIGERENLVRFQKKNF